MGWDIAVAIVGIVVSVASTVYSSVTQANTDSFNKDVANQQAKYASQRAEFEAKQHSIKMRQLLGEQKVAYASSGVSLMSGSAQDIMGDTLEQGAIDAMVIRAGGKAQADAYASQAQQFGEAGSAAVIGGVGKVGSTLLTAYGKYSGGGSVSGTTSSPDGFGGTQTNTGMSSSKI